MGHNIGTNAPRMLHDLQECRQRGVPILVFNPLKEPGLVRFANPQSPVQMLTPAQTQMNTQYHQLKAGGDLAALTGLCKALVALDDQARASGGQQVLDHAFIAEHTHGFEAFCLHLRQVEWPAIEEASGLARAALESAAAVIGRARRVIGIYGMGLTQHRTGVANVQMVANLLLLGGHIGVPGAGILPVRGHSNVQGQRTVGITEKPELAPLDKLAQQYGFAPPRRPGMNTVEACEAILAGKVPAFIALGGNFVRAVPDTARMEAAWRELPLTVQVSTKLNRNHVIHGKASYILPCLGRIEIDRQRGIPQSVSIEDSTSCMHGSRGMAEPAAATLLSEPAIVAGLAKATLAPNPNVDWDAWVADYSRVRDAIETTFPSIFRDFNERMWTPGGFRKPLGAAERVWDTPSKRAEFTVPASLQADADADSPDPAALRLFTVRSDGQFNTTIYSNEDRFRGVSGSRMVLFMSPVDMARLQLADGDLVDLATAVSDDAPRHVRGLRVVAYNVPEGCAAGYYPECNPLIPIWHHALESKVPAAKSIDVLVRRTASS
jgi:molybdopterin-dependent oxidoreductase alpha subunit